MRKVIEVILIYITVLVCGLNYAAAQSITVTKIKTTDNFYNARVEGFSETHVYTIWLIGCERRYRDCRNLEVGGRYEMKVNDTEPVAYPTVEHMLSVRVSGETESSVHCVIGPALWSKEINTWMGY